MGSSTVPYDSAPQQNPLYAVRYDRAKSTCNMERDQLRKQYERVRRSYEKSKLRGVKQAKERKARTKQELAAQGVEPNPGPPKRDPQAPWGTKPKGGQAKGKSKLADVVCRHCGMKGHVQRKCPANTDQTPESTASTSSTAQVVQAVALDEYMARMEALATKWPDLAPEYRRACAQSGMYSEIIRANGDPETVMPLCGLAPPAKPEPPSPAPERLPFLGLHHDTDSLIECITTYEKGYRDRDYTAWWMYLGSILVIALAFAANYTYFSYVGVAAVLLASAACVAFCKQPEIGFARAHQVDLDGGETRIVTNYHIPRQDKPVRAHHYEFDLFDEHYDLYVVDHWLTVALSEHGSGADIDCFLANVHQKFLRAGGLNINCLNYERYKRDTTTYLRLYLKGVFQPPTPAGWAGAVRV